MKPECFGRYVLLKPIAEGGMGQVFVAVPRSPWGFGGFYAIKKILPALGKNSEFLARFRDEARLVIPMSHRNVVQVLEVGRVGLEFFIAMEHVHGKNLGQVLSQLWRARDRLRLSIPAALHIVREVLSALDYCHGRTDAAGVDLRVVHRDVSPSNVLLSYDGEVKLADFGLALSTLKEHRTLPDMVLGHLGYIAPEVLEGKRADARVDLYCAGVLLYELLTCERFAPGSDLVAIRRLLHERGEVCPSRLRPDVPPEVDEIVQRATALAPVARFPDAAVFREAVQRALVRFDDRYDAAELAREVMETLFDPADARQRLAALRQSVDLEALEAERPVARTHCLAEAIPLRRRPGGRPRYGGDTPLLTAVNDVFEGDTERELLVRPAAPVEAEGRTAAATEGQAAATTPAEGRPAPRAALPRRRTLGWRPPIRRRPPRPRQEPAEGEAPVKWVDVKTVQ